jgi:hypothetical protein
MIATDLAVRLAGLRSGCHGSLLLISRPVTTLTYIVDFTPLLLALDSFIDFLSVHGDILGRIDAHPDLVPLHSQHGDRYLVAYHHDLTDPSCQYQHFRVLLNWAAGFVGVDFPLGAPDAMEDPTAPGALHDQPNDPD